MAVRVNGSLCAAPFFFLLPASLPLWRWQGPLGKVLGKEQAKGAVPPLEKSVELGTRLVLRQRP